LVYVIYTASNYSTPGEIELTFGDGFIPVPYFQKGKTTHAQWLVTLDSLKNSAPDVMFSSDRTIMVANMDEALLYRNEDQQLIVDRLDSIIGFSYTLIKYKFFSTFFIGAVYIFLSWIDTHIFGCICVFVLYDTIYRS